MARHIRTTRTLGLAALLIALAAITAAACSPRADAGARAASADARSTATPPATGDAWKGDTVLGRVDASRIQGAAGATLWMVEVSDFQCPFCARWHEETYETIKRDYVDTGKIRFAYVNLPLPMHKHARRAAQAAMCAGLQGKFWPMHSALFASQQRWAPLDSAAADAVFDSLATQSGANAAQVRACVNAGTTLPLVQADYDRSVQSGVNSTPTFFIGSKVISGAAPTAEFRAALDSALAAGPAR